MEKPFRMVSGCIFSMVIRNLIDIVDRQKLLGFCEMLKAQHTFNFCMLAFTSDTNFSLILAQTFS